MEKYQEQIKLFERWNLDKTGHYIGADLTKYGFPYQPGNYVPIDKRYSATCELNHAITAIILSSRVNISCPICGSKMIPVGIGVYPYDCDAKRKVPNAMIFDNCENGHTGWHCSSKNVF